MSYVYTRARARTTQQVLSGGKRKLKNTRLAAALNRDTPHVHIGRTIVIIRSLRGPEITLRGRTKQVEEKAIFHGTW